MKKLAALICLLGALCTWRPAASADSAALAQKMDRIIFPKIQFTDATLEEAVDYLRVKSRDLDTSETRRTRKGVNLVVRNAEDKRTSPLVSLDIKAVSLKTALSHITEQAGCVYTIEDLDVVVESRALQGRREASRPPAEAAQAPASIQLSVQMAEQAEAQDPILPRSDVAYALKPKSGKPEFVLRGIFSEPQCQEILKAMVPKKHLTLHTPDSRIVSDESTTTFPIKADLSTMKVTVEADPTQSTLDAQIGFPESVKDRDASLSVSLWSGQTALLARSIPDGTGHFRNVFFFVSATLLDARGKPWLKSGER